MKNDDWNKDIEAIPVHTPVQLEIEENYEKVYDGIGLDYEDVDIHYVTVGSTPFDSKYSFSTIIPRVPEANIDDIFKKGSYFCSIVQVEDNPEYYTIPTKEAGHRRLRIIGWKPLDEIKKGNEDEM